MNRLLLAILLLVGVSAHGAVYMNYYTTNASPTLPGSVTATNAIGNNGGTGTNTWLGGITTITNLVLPAGFTNAWKSDATNAAASKIAMNGGTGTNIVLEGLTTATNLTTATFTNTSATASTVAAFNAGKGLYSIANGAGFLTDDGGGAFTWTTSLNASNLSGNVPNSSIPGWVASGTDVVNATNTSSLNANGLALKSDATNAANFAAQNATNSTKLSANGFALLTDVTNEALFATQNATNNTKLHVNATNIDYNLDVTNFNGGASASGTTYWRGDGTWATPTGSGNGTLTTVSTNGTAVSAAATNLNLYAGANVTINATNAGNRVDVTIASTASGTAGAVTNGDTRTIGVSGLIVSNTMSAGEFDVGTLVVTNPPALNLSASTNYGGTYYASNALSGGQFPIGSLATGVTAVAGPFLTSNTVARSYSYNAGGLTNISPANIVSGTLPAAILSSATSALSGPAENELPTAQWVRSLFNNGILDYATTNIDSVATNPATLNQVVYQFSTAVPQTAVRTWASGFITNNGYIGSVVTTNTFTFLQGPVVVNAYIGATTAGPIGNYFLTLHPEIYYSYDRTNWSGDYTAQAQSITGNATNLYQFVITFPSVTATNSTGFYVQRRLKIDTASTAGNVPTVYFFVGTNTFTSGNASHMAFSGPSSAAGNAYLANNQVFTGLNTFSQPIVGSGNSLTNLNAANLTGTVNANVVGTIYDTNIAHAVTTGWGGTSNTVALAGASTTINIDATGHVGITNITGATAGILQSALLVVSNSTASTIGIYWTNATWRTIGTASTTGNTNGLPVPSGKIGIVSIGTVGTQDVLISDTVQQ